MAASLGSSDRSMLRWVWRYRWRYLAGGIALLVVDASDAVLPIVIKWAIDDIVLLDGLIPIALIIGAYLGIVAVQATYRYWWRQYFVGASHRVVTDVRAQLFRHLQALPYDYHARTKTGDLMGRLTNDLTATRLFFGPGMLMMADAAMYFLLIPPAMLYLSPTLTLWTLIPLPIVPFFVYWMSRAIRRRSEEVQERFSDIAARCEEGFRGIRVVQSFARENEELDRLESLSRAYVEENMDLARFQAGFRPALGLVMQGGVFIVLIAGGLQAIDGEITVGTFVAFQSFLSRMVWPMMAIGWSIGIYQRGTAAMGRLLDVLAEPEDEDAPPGSGPSAIRGEVRLEDVRYRYPEAEEEALRGVDLELDPGRTVALTGPVGGGKSTLLNLIPRVLRSTEGRVTVDGRPIDEIPAEVLRRSVGYVPQETFLFSDSIAENIALGLEADGTDREAVREAAEKAQIAEHVEGLSEGYDALLGERGVNLSGGQRQRVAIARALIMDPSILLLDDCLSAVDAETEHRILRALSSEIRERASVIVSHRVSTLRDADEILVLVEGEVAERGTHEELVGAGGPYQEMVERQRLLEELDAS